MSLATHKEGFSLFHLFEVVPGMFQPLLATYGFFVIISFLISNSITECFDLQIYYESTGKGNRFWQF